MEQWIDIASKFGIPVVIVGLLGYFLLKHVWPFVTDQIKGAQAERKVEIDKFVTTIQQRDNLQAAIQREHIKALEGLTAEIRGWRTEAKGGRR